MGHLSSWKSLLTPNIADNYAPSSELLATFTTLPGHLLTSSQPHSNPPPNLATKNEADISKLCSLPSICMDGDRSPASDYRPSDALLATFATLPPQFLNQGKHDHNITKPIKQEDTSK